MHAPNDKFVKIIISFKRLENEAARPEKYAKIHMALTMDERCDVLKELGPYSTGRKRSLRSFRSIWKSHKILGVYIER